jgi:ketosteroid isomerase-like protein
VRHSALHHFALVGQQFSSVPQSRRPVDVTIHQTDDPEVVVSEFTYETVVAGETLYTPCIWVTRVQGGRIIEARDYNGQPSPTRATDS